MLPIIRLYTSSSSFLEIIMTSSASRGFSVRSSQNSHSSAGLNTSTTQFSCHPRPTTIAPATQSNTQWFAVLITTKAITHGYTQPNTLNQTCLPHVATVHPINRDVPKCSEGIAAMVNTKRLFDQSLGGFAPGCVSLGCRTSTKP